MSKQLAFTKKDRLLKPIEFTTAFKKGKKTHTNNFIVCVFKKNSEQTGIKKLGISVGSAVGNAVKRNRLKRLVREYFRLNKIKLLPNITADIVINLKKDNQLKYLKNVTTELDKILAVS